MRLLIITQKVDFEDDILGFFHSWLAEFAKHCEKVVTICLQKGQHDLPENVKVLSLGKEKLPACGWSAVGRKIWRRAKYALVFLKYIWTQRRSYEVVLVHMNPEYVLLGWKTWRLLGKKIALWYAHGHAGLALKIAAKLVDVIFTSTRSGCRIKSRKIRVIGQGIDTAKFQIPNSKFQIKSKTQIPNPKLRVITVGRISPVKDYVTLIEAVEILANEGDNLQVSIIGGAGLPKHEKYLTDLKKMVREKGLAPLVHFIGPVPNKDIAQYLQSADLFVNMSQTGSLDKAVLEAMACGLPILTCNEALREVLGEYQDVLMYRPKDAQQLAEKIRQIKSLKQAEREKLSQDLREIVVENHSLAGFIAKLLAGLKGLTPLVQVDQVYDQIVKEKYQGDYEYNRWLADELKKAGYQMTLNTIRQHILTGKLNFEDYLELGPGAGTWTKFFLEKYPKAQFDLVDISDEMLKLAKAKLTDYPACADRKNIRYFRQDFLNFMPEKKYDLFFSCRAIEYLSNKEAVVKKITDLLKPGGQGFIITKTPKYFRAKLLGRKIPKLHRGQISPRALKKLLEKYGFFKIETYLATMSFPLLRSAGLNKFLHRIFYKHKLNLVSKFFAESYLVKFRKCS